MKEKITKSFISKSIPDCYLLSNFVDKEFSDQLIKEVLSLPLKREIIKMFGRDIEVPREIIWMSNPGISYRYSGIQHSPYPWSTNIKILHNLIIKQIGDFNSVLINVYKTGEDYMGYHQDNEPEVDNSCGIFSLSLGQSRDFLFKSLADKQKIIKIMLSNCDGLYMGPATLKDWKHALPKRKNIKKIRVNLTFRRIFPESSLLKQ